MGILRFVKMSPTRSSQWHRDVGRRAVKALQLLSLVLVLGLSACGFAKAKEDAEHLLTRHFEAVASHSTQAVLAGYDERFFAVVPREEWTKRLATVEAKLGPYQSFSVSGWNVHTNLGVGTTVKVTCKVKYAKYDATEAMELFRTGDDQPFKIVKHGINSDGFLSE